MKCPKIETPDTFITYQEQAIEAAYSNSSVHYWPVNKDLVRVLRGWKGAVFMEIMTEAAPISVKVVKQTLISEIINQWNPDEICNLSISSVRPMHGVLELKQF